MTSSLEYVRYVTAQLNGVGTVSYKKLSDEHSLWCGGTFFGTVKDNQFYMKVTETGHKHLPETGPMAPHGGHPGMCLVEELDNREFLTALILDACGQLLEPHKSKQSVSKPSQPKSRKRES